MQELAKLRDEFEIVGDVRGKGLMTGVELVEDKVNNLTFLNVFLFVSLIVYANIIEIKKANCC